MNRSLFALACLALAGCPTTNTASDSGPRVDVPTVDAPTVDAPIARCMPEGTWAPLSWVGDPTNAAGCVNPGMEPVRFNAEGTPIGSDGAAFVCPAMCDAMSCSVMPVAGPSCTGMLSVARACTGGPGGTARFTLRGDTFDFEVRTEAPSGDGFCTFRGAGNRVDP